MITENQLPLPTRETFTAGEVARREEMAGLRAFLIANYRPMPDAHRGPGTPCDWNDARHSLSSHPVVQYHVYVLACSATLEKFAFLDTFELLHPDIYLSELDQDITAASDNAARERLTAKTESFARDNEIFPEHLTLAKQNIQIHKSLASDGLRKALQFCKRLIRDWLEIMPAENFRELLNEIEQLETAPVANQMKFFGLADLIPMEGK